MDQEKMGLFIDQLRKEKNLTQKELAEKVGVAVNTISQYESGISKTSIDVLANLAVELETTTDYLLGLCD